MIWESVVWVAVALTASPMMRVIEAPLKARWPSAWPAVRDLAPWVFGLGPAYLALITGAVLARSYGLDGRAGAVGWLVSILIFAGVTGAVWGMRHRLGPLAAEVDLTVIVLDELRWALYRAAGLLWFGAWGLMMGFALGWLEWGLRTRPWLADSRHDRGTWLILARLDASSLLFALTGNFWVTCLTQALGWFALRRAGSYPPDIP